MDSSVGCSFSESESGAGVSTSPVAGSVWDSSMDSSVGCSFSELGPGAGVSTSPVADSDLDSSIGTSVGCLFSEPGPGVGVSASPVAGSDLELSIGTSVGCSFSEPEFGVGCPASTNASFASVANAEKRRSLKQLPISMMNTMSNTAPIRILNFLACRFFFIDLASPVRVPTHRLCKAF